MKKIILAIAAFSVIASASLSAIDLGQKVDKKSQQRILITTDLEVDDMNGVLLSLMFSDQYDLAGIVWTAGMFHWNGDGGVHKLADITPNFKCSATHVEHSVKNAGELSYYRPADPTWLGRVLDYYEEDYKFLSQNNPNYPTPEYLRSITKVGNVEFEGDYRFETEGSKFIEQLIMDDDMRPLVIQHWGGINTTVRALYSIYEKYHGTPEWEKVLAKVVSKVRFRGSGEDNCRADSKIDEMFPGLQDQGYSMGFFSYGSFYSSAELTPGVTPSWISRRSPEELQPYLHKDWIFDAYKKNHGQVLGEIWLMGEGRALYGEPYIYNYGIIDFMDWSLSARLGWGPENLLSYDIAPYERYSWAFCQFGCASAINIGLRTDVQNRDNHYTAVMWEELAARADWAIMGPDKANHAPVVKAEALDLTCKAGKSVTMNVTTTDPDGNALASKWYMQPASSSYKEGNAEGLALTSVSETNATFTVPKDAKIGDKFVVTYEVQDKGVERPMTRFAQFVITVTKK